MRPRKTKHKQSTALPDSPIRDACNKRDKMESALHTIVSACDEALAANNAGLDMAWYEANIIIAVFNALKALPPA